MILGDTCTRRCRFCAVKTGLPGPPDELEPGRVAASIEKLGIAHAVITMVNRDDLDDGGAALLAATGRAIRHRTPEVTVEYLSSDMAGRWESVEQLLESKPDILAHNIETVRRLTPQVRSRSDYDRSLEFLRIAKERGGDILTKSGMMLGLGETRDEILGSLDDLRNVDCDIVNLGQYLQPTRRHIPVKEYRTPEEFADLADRAREKGFLHVESGPLVRSSYHAGDQLAALLAARRG
jgi:lipoic acid synthetase